MKVNLVKRYNELKSRFSDALDLEKEFDLGIPCDLLLDLLRYEDKEILNPALSSRTSSRARNRRAPTQSRTSTSGSRMRSWLRSSRKSLS